MIPFEPARQVDGGLPDDHPGRCICGAGDACKLLPCPERTEIAIAQHVGYGAARPWTDG